MVRLLEKYLICYNLNNIEENVNFDVEDSMRDSMKDLLSAYDYTDPNMTPEELNEYYNENIPKFF